jgi:hypothetical protein
MAMDDTPDGATPNATRLDPLILVAGNFYGLADAKLSLGNEAPLEWNAMLTSLKAKVVLFGGTIEERDTPMGSLFIVHGPNGAIIDRALGVPHRERYLNSAAIARLAE